VAALADTNILVYRFDPRDRRKQRIATELLREGIAAQSLVIAHQAIVEFYAAVTRRSRDEAALLDTADAIRETEDLMLQFNVLFPTPETVRAALRAGVAYQLSWFDALMWAHAETSGIAELISEDFQHGRAYGSVRVRNPFV
jgi:predicted nucleic acid-binding protein